MNCYTVRDDRLDWTMLGIISNFLHGFQSPTKLCAIYNFANNGIFAVEMRLFAISDKKLRQYLQEILTCDLLVLGALLAIATIPRALN